MPRLVLLRHGQSLWNLQNRFTGWVDIPLSRKGIEEAQLAGQKMASLEFSRIFVSSLIRAQMTAMLAMEPNLSQKVPRMEHEASHLAADWGRCFDEQALASTIPVTIAWQLNERYYGELQGLNKQATIDKFGADQVKIWRRSYDTPPPSGESLKDTAARTLPFFHEEIEPLLLKGESLFVCAHGNSLRSIMMDLEQLSPDEVVALELATGEPVIYECQVDSQGVLSYKREYL